MQLCRQRPTCQSLVMAILLQPGQIFSLAVKAGVESNVTEEVMNRSKPVVRATELATEERMIVVGVTSGSGYLQYLLRAGSADHFSVTRVRRRTLREGDSNVPGQGLK